MNQAAYRHCDAIAGGTWEALNKYKIEADILGGLRKVEAASKMVNISTISRVFHLALLSFVMLSLKQCNSRDRRQIATLQYITNYLPS